MRIGVEIRNIHFGASGGIAPLIRGVLAAAFANRPGDEFVVYATLFNSTFFGETPANVRIRVLPPHGYWRDLAGALQEDRIDVLFRGYPGQAIDGFPNARQIVLVPDLQHEQHPEFFSRTDLFLRRQLFRSALKGAGAIATISEFARATLAARDETRDADIFLMPPASQLGAPGISVAAAFADRVLGSRPYFYYPANLWKHKNHERLLAAFARFRARGGTHSLLLSGHPGGWPELARRHADLPVHHLGFVSNAELRHLYEHAHALVFFSLYEGFGMPLLEAFETGCPVLCSNTTSLPEVAGDAALCCDPTDVDAMAALLGRIASDEGLRQDLVERGRARRGHYSWSRSAEAFIEACGRIVAPVRIQVPAPARPRVSIVTPSYNQGRFLERTIQSVLAQRYPDIEYIVVDGGSTDDSVSILRRYEGRLQWTSERDEGQTDAINKGLARSSGSVQAYLNSDDTLAPDAIEKVVGFLSQRPEVDLVYGDANYVDEEDRVTGRYNTAEYSFERLMFDCCICQPAAFWRTSIARTVGPFDASLDLVMDYDYWLRIDRAGGKLQYLPEVLANSRLYPDTKTLSRRRDIYREIFEVCRRHGGYVHHNYYLGYWHHVLHERPGAWALIRRLPHAHAALAHAHQAWDTRDAAVARSLASPRVEPLRRAYRRLRSRTPLRGADGTRSGVRGFLWDGWLGPTVTIDTSAVVPGSELFLTGRPAVPCEVEIQQEARVIHVQRLGLEEIAQIRIRVDSPAALELRFSAHIVDAAKRQLSFLALATNLFAEADVVSS